MSISEREARPDALGLALAKHLAAAKAQGAAEERAAVIAVLTLEAGAYAKASRDEASYALLTVADRVERGDHLPIPPATEQEG